MAAILYAAGLVAGASAAALPRADECCFQLTASGGQSGTVGQYTDGQNRIGGSYSPATYCLSNGAITDKDGRGCILTPPTTQFQCDVGATPTSGFSVGSSGEVEYNGSNQFYACPASDSEYNIYTTPVSGQDKCVKITLSTGGKCQGSGSGSSSVAPSPSSQAQSQPSTPGYGAPSSSAAKPSTPAQSQPSAPGYDSPSSSEEKPTTPAQTTPKASAPGYGAPSSSEGKPTTPASVSQPSAPGYSAPSESKATVPVQSSASKPSAPGYGAPSSQESKPSAPAYTQPTSESKSIPVQTPPVVTTKIQTTVYHSSPAPSAPSESSPAPSAPAPSGTKPAASQSGSACQTSLTGAYQTPHLIVPVDKQQPDKAYGTQYNATISSEKCTIFNFDIPQDYSGKTCSTVFLFPEQSQLETSAYTFSGSGSIAFSELSSSANEQTTWNSCPSKKNELGSVAAKPGNSYAVSTDSCEAGKTVSIEACSEGGLSLEFFEDWNPSPIGVYITSC